MCCRRTILNAPQDGLSGAVRARGRGPRGHGVVRDVLLDRRDARARRHRSCRRRRACSTTTQPAAADGGDALWSLLNLELWYRTFIDGDGVQTLAARRGAASTVGAGVEPRGAARPGADGLTHAHPLAERRPAAAARQGRQAAHVAPDAAPRAAPRDHVPLVRRPGSAAEPTSTACARSPSAVESRFRGAGPAKGTLRVRTPTPRATSLRSAAVRGRQVPIRPRTPRSVAELLRAGALRPASSATSCRRP